jgi:hypothetical protein
VSKIEQSLRRHAVGKDQVVDFINRELRPLADELRREVNRLNAAPATITEDTVLNAEQHVVVVDASSAAVQITLPSLTDFNGDPDQQVIGREYVIKSIDSTYEVSIVGTIGDIADTTLATNESIWIRAGITSWRTLAERRNGIYAGISVVGNSTQTAIAVAGTAVQFVLFDTNHPSSRCTPDHTNNHITIEIAGNYLVTGSATIESIAGGGSVARLDVLRNNGSASSHPITASRQMSGGGGDEGTISLNGIVTFAAGDTVELWVTNETNTQNYILDKAVLSVFRFGG